MKKKNKKLYSVVALVLTFVFLFSLSSSALDVRGQTYTLCGKADQTNVSTNSIIDFVIYQNYSTNLHDSSSYGTSSDLYFVDALINTLGFVKIGNWDLSDSLFLNHLQSFNEGTYYVADSVYISPNIELFIKSFNGMFKYLDYYRNVNDVAMNGINSGSINFLFAYNTTLSLLIEHQVVGYFSWLAKNGYLNLVDKDIAHTFETSYLYVNDVYRVYNSIDYDSVLMQVNWELSPYIRYPITVNYDLESSFKLLKNPNTWSFLPTQISALIVSFLVTIIAIAFTAGVRKKFT